MEDLSLHILDIAENSIDAGAEHIEILVKENSANDSLTIEVSDDGKGIDQETLNRITDPFYTTGTVRNVGLGLSLLEEAARRANGRLDIHSGPTDGTKVRATFQLSHIDRQPLGNLAETVTALVARRPEADIVFVHDINGRKFVFRTLDVRPQLHGAPINSSGSLAFIRKYLSQEEEQLSHKHFTARHGHPRHRIHP